MKNFQKNICNLYSISGVLIHTKSVEFKSTHMKTILTETVAVVKVSLFWMVALPVAAIIFPVAAGLGILNSLMTQGRDDFGRLLRAAA